MSVEAYPYKEVEETYAESLPEPEWEPCDCNGYAGHESDCSRGRHPSQQVQLLDEGCQECGERIKHLHSGSDHAYRAMCRAYRELEQYGLTWAATRMFAQIAREMAIAFGEPRFLELTHSGDS